MPLKRAGDGARRLAGLVTVLRPFQALSPTMAAMNAAPSVLSVAVGRSSGMGRQRG